MFCLDSHVRIGVIADLHLNHMNEETRNGFFCYLKQLNLSTLIYAGDQGETIDCTIEAIQQAKQFIPVVGVLLGNHNLWCWTNDPNLTTEDLWTETYPKAVRDSGAIWLEEEDIYLNEHTVIIGSIAWYDYSGKWEHDFRNRELIEYTKKKYNNDGNYIRWQRTDHEFATECLQNFSKRLAKLETDKNIQRIIVVTHVPLFRETMIYPNPGPNDAYFYNLTFGSHILLNSGKTTDVISGHTHQGIDCLVQGAYTQMRCQVVPSDYGHPAIVIIS